MWKSWRTGTAVLLVLVVCCAPVVAAEGDDRAGAPVKVYVDESRSLQLPIVLWKHLKQRDGCFQTRVFDLITYERLRQYDVMIIWNQIDDIAYSEDELAAVRRFVTEGGGLLVLGTPHLDASERARFRQGRFVNIKPVPANRYSLNQIAALFGASFTNASRHDLLKFPGGAKVNSQTRADQLGFKQPFAVVNLPAAGFEVLLRWDDQPVAAALDVGKGRLIVCGANRLFLQYGKLADRKQGKTDDVIAQQKALLVSWVDWLAEKSPVRDKTATDLPEFVPGRMHLKTDQIDVYCIPQFESQAKRLVSNWERVWKDFEVHTGLTSPLELVDGGASANQKLQVYLRAAEAGGLSGGTSISIASLNEEEWRLIGVLSHEVGHKLLGGCNVSVSEAFAEWMNARGLTAAGFTKESRAKIDDHIADFLKVDPSHDELDIADARTDITQSGACQGKWIWILGQLQDKYGQDFIKKYVVALRQDVTLAGPARKLLPNGRRAKLTMADHVRAFSRVGGEDLTPWFRELGITVEDR
jgi:hypothetical protein